MSNLTPGGTLWPLNSAPEYGTTRGTRPGTPNDSLVSVSHCESMAPTDLTAVLLLSRQSFKFSTLKLLYRRDKRLTKYGSFSSVGKSMEEQGSGNTFWSSADTLA